MRVDKYAPPVTFGIPETGSDAPNTIQWIFPDFPWHSVDALPPLRLASFSVVAHLPLDTLAYTTPGGVLSLTKLKNTISDTDTNTKPH